MSPNDSRSAYLEWEELHWSLKKKYPSTWDAWQAACDWMNVQSNAGGCPSGSRIGSTEGESQAHAGSNPAPPAPASLEKCKAALDSVWSDNCLTECTKAVLDAAEVKYAD